MEKYVTVLLGLYTHHLHGQGVINGGQVVAVASSSELSKTSLAAELLMIREAAFTAMLEIRPQTAKKVGRFAGRI